jgi:hypothetical protein
MENPDQQPEKIVPQADIDRYKQLFPETIPLRRDPESERPRKLPNGWTDFQRWPW